MTSQNQKSHCALKHEGDKVPVSALEYTATTYEHDRVRKLTQKCDRYLMPPLFLIWFFPIIDLTSALSATIKTKRLDVFNRFASPLGGLLAYAIVGTAGTDGKLRWKWMFIIKILINMALACSAFSLNSDQPHEAASLNDEERKLLEARIF